MLIWHILISESDSVYCWDVVGLLSVCVRDFRSAVGYDSSIVLMISFQSVSCQLSIGLKSGDSISILTRNDPDMNPTGFMMSSATLSVADIQWKFCGSCRFRVGLAGVIGALTYGIDMMETSLNISPTGQFGGKIADDIFKCIFFQIKILELGLKFWWGLFLMVQLTMNQHWFR